MPGFSSIEEEEVEDKEPITPDDYVELVEGEEVEVEVPLVLTRSAKHELNGVIYHIYFQCIHGVEDSGDLAVYEEQRDIENNRYLVPSDLHNQEVFSLVSYLMAQNDFIHTSRVDESRAKKVMFRGINVY